MKKKTTTKTTVKKDFDIIAHVINMPESKKSFKWGDSSYTLIALYINKYGAEIGGVCRDIKSGEIISMDPFLYAEFIGTGRFYS